MVLDSTEVNRESINSNPTDTLESRDVTLDSRVVILDSRDVILEFRDSNPAVILDPVDVIRESSRLSMSISSSATLAEDPSEISPGQILYRGWHFAFPSHYSLSTEGAEL